MRRKTSKRRYSKVSTEMWGDDAFRGLTPLPPSGQSLWLYLLTCPYRSIVPGLVLHVGLGTLDDRLGWGRETVARHWQELVDAGMAASDWQAGVIWLPNAIAHNRPDSPNVIVGWRKVDLPACPLVDRALLCLRGALQQPYDEETGEGYTEPFLHAFDKTFPHVSAQHAKKGACRVTGRATGRATTRTAVEGSGKASVHPFTQPSPQVYANQEQEQDQDSTHPKPRPLGGACGNLSDDIRQTLEDAIGSVPEDAWATTRASHAALADALTARGWTVEREVRVVDRGDGRAGYVDLVVTAPAPLVIDVEPQRPRRKTLEKLSVARSQGFASVVVCRDAAAPGWWVDGEVWVWGLPPVSASALRTARLAVRALGRCPHDPPCVSHAACVHLFARRQA